MPESVPLIVKPDIVTVLLLPAFLLLKVPTAAVVIRLTKSDPYLPERDALPVFMVAAVAAL